MGRPLEQRRKDLEFRVPIPRDATASGACGLWRRSDTQSSAHRSWGDTEDPCCLGGLEIPAKTAARGQRACHVCAILCASVLGDARSYCSPTCHSKWERYSEGTPPGDTQSSAHRSSGHARSPVVPPRSLPPLCAAGEQEKNGPRSSARRPAKELAGRHATSSDTQSSAHRSWGDTQDPCGLGGLEIPAKTAARGQRACH